MDVREILSSFYENYQADFDLSSIWAPELQRDTVKVTLLLHYCGRAQVLMQSPGHSRALQVL